MMTIDRPMTMTNNHINRCDGLNNGRDEGRNNGMMAGRKDKWRKESMKKGSKKYNRRIATQFSFCETQ